MSEIYTIELNLDDDYSSTCSYHVDSLQNTINKNIQSAEQGIKIQRWVLVGLAESWDDACEKAEKLQKLLCHRNNKKFKGLPFHDPIEEN